MIFLRGKKERKRKKNIKNFFDFLLRFMCFSPIGDRYQSRLYIADSSVRRPVNSTIQIFGPSILRLFNLFSPPVLQPLSPPALQFSNPSALQPSSPSVLQPFSPSALQSFSPPAFSPSVLQLFSSSTSLALQHF